VLDSSDVDVNAVITTFVLTLDLIGTFVFALSGAMAAVNQRLDFFGIMVLAFAAGNAGGITRDVLIGARRPAAITDWRYLAVALLAGLLCFFAHRSIQRLRNPVQVFDAVGLALFAVCGTQKALVFGANPMMAAVLGMVTAIGGGMLRDVLLREVPTVLRSEIYAIAALAGAAVVVAGELLHLPSAIPMFVGAALCFGIRMVAIRRSWQLPSPSLSDVASSTTRSSCAYASRPSTSERSSGSSSRGPGA
jgi:uncharacterized membrane protein YeiH